MKGSFDPKGFLTQRLSTSGLQATAAAAAAAAAASAQAVKMPCLSGSWPSSAKPKGNE